MSTPFPDHIRPRIEFLSEYLHDTSGYKYCRVGANGKVLGIGLRGTFSKRSLPRARQSLYANFIKRVPLLDTTVRPGYKDLGCKDVRGIRIENRKTGYFLVEP